MGITQLFQELEAFETETSNKAGELQSLIQTELDRTFDDWAALQSAVANLESFEGVEYFSEGEDICSFVRFDCLADVADRERDYLESYLSGRGVLVDWKNEVLSQYLGPDCIIIQDDHGRDNGVYQEHKQLFDEDDYRDEDGEIDEQKRNALIESHMERTGCWPGVFRVTRHGDVYPVNTNKK
jgi:hypothetical protein